jgi:transposase
MDQPTQRKTFKYKLKPTPEQEWELERVLGLCRNLYNTALEQRVTEKGQKAPCLSGGRNGPASIAGFSPTGEQVPW